MIDKKIAFIGCGHISHAIINGLLKANAVDKNKIILSGPHLKRFADLARKYHIGSTTVNAKAVQNADIIFIGIRPKVVEKVTREIKNHIKGGTLIISVAAGVTFALLHKYFSAKDIKLVRIIPNIPVAYGLGVVGWVGDNLTTNDKILMKSLLKPLGLITECKDENMMDKLSMISGCGIGYVAYFMKNLEEIGKSYGLNEDIVSKIVLNTFAGTVKHLSETGVSSQDLVTAVATKGGITEEIINSMENFGFNKIFSESVNKGYVKIKRLTKEM